MEKSFISMDLQMNKANDRREISYDPLNIC